MSAADILVAARAELVIHGWTQGLFEAEDDFFVWWNDDPDRTLAEVLDAYDRAITLAKERGL